MEGDALMESSMERNDTLGEPSVMEEKDRLRNENIRMITTLNRVLKKNRQLALTKEYVIRKEIEYGDFGNILEVLTPLSDEYKIAEDKFAALKEEYAKASANVTYLPGVISAVRNDTAGLKEGVFLVRSEAAQILEAFPGLEELAMESERITTEHHAVQKDLLEKNKVLHDLQQRYDGVKKEKATLESNVSAKRKELAALTEDEASHRDKLADITRRAQMQQELTEEKQILEKAMRSMEKGLEEKRGKIKNHEIQSAQWNTEIGELKTQSAALRAELKDYQALVVPFLSLKTSLENAQGEISDLDGQIARLAEEVDKIRKDEEMLRIKARQFEEIKKGMTGRIK